MTVQPKWNTLQEMLASLEGASVGARFVSRTETESFHTYDEILKRARAAAGYLQARGIRPGDRIGLVLPTSLRFFDAYLGAILAGAIPAALYPPFRLGKLKEYYERTSSLLRRIGAKALITDRRVGKLLGSAVSGVDSLENVLYVEDLEEGGAWTPVAGDPDGIAFLQFSSGSTREPKAVIMSHRNVLCNLEMMRLALATLPGGKPDDGGVCWLPLYHDMGLVGCLFNGLYYPGTVTFINPEDFIVKPALWLRTISKYRSQVSPAPHFAYRLCVSKVKDSDMEGVDLSCWRLALNGAEPIEADGVRLFQERFGRWGFAADAMTPVYGLAEAGLAVSFPDAEAPTRTLSFDRDALSTERRAIPGEGRVLLSVGRALPGVEIEIRDEEDRVLEPGDVGRILIRGNSITPGYYNDPESTSKVLKDGWLDTGDLGFMYEGSLYITGRLKDLIIIRGRNYAPQEIEELLLDVPGVRTGCTVAVSQFVDGQGEELVVLAETDPRVPRPAEELETDIRNRIISGVSLVPYVVQLLEPGTLPRTSSGKFRRSEALRMYLAQELVAPEKVTSLKLLVELGKSTIAWGKFKGTRG